MDETMRVELVGRGLSLVAATFYAGALTWSDEFKAAVDTVAGPGAGESLSQQLEALPQQEYEDSHRIALLGHGPDEAEYEDRITCCGSNRHVIQAGTAQFVYGYNFGH